MTPVRDQFYTPSAVANTLIRASIRRRQLVVADFSAGDGELLRAASLRWPASTIVATDLDRRCVMNLRRLHPSWHSGQCDFLCERSRRRSPMLRSVLGKVTLAVLNPPFSCRGAHTELVRVGDDEVRCSPAMAFVLGALPYLSADGEVIALLPASTISSVKDRQAWHLLSGRVEARHVVTCERGTFENCTARSVIVALSKAVRCLRVDQTAAGPPASHHVSVAIVRGVVPMHRALNGWAGGEFPFVHTTDLQGEPVVLSSRFVQVGRRAMTGPAVFLPRVGEPQPTKCVLYLSRQRVVLSDCVYAIRCKSVLDARRLHEAILSDWNLVSSFYGGTCARHLTLQGLRDLLHTLGYGVCDAQ